MQKEKKSTLKYLLQNYYHQDVWDDMNTHEEVWRFFVRRESIGTVSALKDEVKLFLNQDPQKIYILVGSENSGGLWFNEAKEAYQWLLALNSFLDLVNIGKLKNLSAEKDI